jgi:hypothetical protein
MPVQQIELEEVAMMEVSDEALEKSSPCAGAYTGLQATTCCTQQTVCPC